MESIIYLARRRREVDGVHEITVLERFCQHFGLHPLLLEDVAHTGQRPKLESYGDHLFMDLNVFHLAEGDEIHTEQISLVLGRGWLLSFNQRPQPWAPPLRERLKADKGRCRQGGADYLAYSILDAIVDDYYVVLERIGDRIEAREEELMAAPTPQTLHAVYALKREVSSLRKSIWPLRELIAGLQRERDLVIQPMQVSLHRCCGQRTCRSRTATSWSLTFSYRRPFGRSPSGSRLLSC